MRARAVLQVAALTLFVVPIGGAGGGRGGGGNGGLVPPGKYIVTVKVPGLTKELRGELMVAADPIRK